jgi:hypothetical protein
MGILALLMMYTPWSVWLVVGLLILLDMLLQ